MREGGIILYTNVIAPLPWERGWGEVKKERKGLPGYRVGRVN
jgi:hypothetical protein